MLSFRILEETKQLNNDKRCLMKLHVFQIVVGLAESLRVISSYTNSLIGSALQFEETHKKKQRERENRFAGGIHGCQTI